MVQFIWLRNSVQTAEREFDKDILTSMGNIAEKVEADAVCFEMFSQQVIGKGQDFFLLAPQMSGDTTILDTVETYYWEALGTDTIYNYKKFSFSAPVSVNINLTVNYLHDNSLLSSDSLNKMEQHIANIFENSLVLRDNNLEYKVLDTFFLEAAIGIEFESLGKQFTYKYAVYDPVEQEVLNSSDWVANANIIEAGYNMGLYSEDKFMTPLQLYIWFPQKRWGLFQAFLPLTFAFLILIASLAIFMSLSFRSVAHHRKLAQLKIDLVNNMTHEFNTPIANISLALDTLKNKNRKKGSLAPDKILEIIGYENGRLMDNVEKVMKVSLIENNNLNLSETLVDMHQLIEEVLKRIELSLLNKGGKVRTLLKATNSKILGDRIHLSNVLYNLLDNTIKYSKQGVQILIETYNSHRELRLLIKDNGIGMATSDLPYIFDKFYRINESNRHDIKGFGLGLHYVKNIVNAHKGGIDVSSKKGEGTTFRIKLPNNE